MEKLAGDKLKVERLKNVMKWKRKDFDFYMDFMDFISGTGKMTAWENLNEREKQELYEKTVADAKRQLDKFKKVN